MSNETPMISISLEVPNHKIGSTPVHHAISFKIPMPMSLSEDDLQMMQRDFEIFREITKEKPEQFKSLVEAISKGDNEKVLPLVNTLGFSESAFQERGGGWIGLVIAGAILLYGSRAH